MKSLNAAAPQPNGKRARIEYAPDQPAVDVGRSRIMRAQSGHVPNLESNQPPWPLPAGISRGLWDYVHADHIADDYDAYFSHNRLFDFDEQIVLSHVKTRQLNDGVAADLGCGTGRAIMALARCGMRGLAIDLSPAMLAIVRIKADQADLPIDCIHANLVELNCVGEDTVDVAVSLFSTLGMIQGRDNRQLALQHTRRILRPGGLFFLHVHNLWYNLRDLASQWWLFKNLLRSTFVRDLEAGDKFFDYRGLSNMFLHAFTLGELQGALHQAGFRIVETIPLDKLRHRGLRWPWWFGRLRANGWIVVCE
jgi:ubiquinone/menaquinone biosynthesis C-methylase UbiE